MGRKRRCRGKGDSSSSDTSSGDDEMSTAATASVRRTSDSLDATGKQRNMRKREDKGIKKMLKELREDTSEIRRQLQFLIETKDDTKEIRKQLKKLTESHNELRQHLFHINGSSGDDSAAPRSELNQVQPPRYRLEFTCEVNDEIEKGQSIETKNHGKTISVALYDDHNQIVETEPLASSTVMLVVVNGEFNQHDNQYNWLRKDFERNIKKPRQKVSATEDVNQPIESIVSNCVFKLDGGVKIHTGATILYNSSNKKVRLGVMVLSSTQERVLEGLSNPFFVRGHDRPARQKQALVGYGGQERNGPTLNMQNSSWPILNQPSADIRSGPIVAPNNIALSTEPSISLEEASMLQDQFSHPMTYWTSMAQATNSLPSAGEHLPLHNDYSRDSNLTLHNYSVGNNRFPVPTNGAQFNMDQIARPVLLIWDKPNLDQLMPLYSCSTKFYNCGVPAMLQTTRPKKGVLIEPLEPDESDEGRLLKRKLHSKYRLGFVNEVCETYYIWEKIEASGGDFLKVALFDENNTRVTSGPLASVSVEVVVLHGDFNADGQHYWTPEEFSCCVVHPKAGNEPPVLRGEDVLALVDGEACLCDAFFQITSYHARTGKFKLGVALASAQEERIQEGISEPFRVTREYNKGTGRPSGFRFHPTDQELILQLLRRHAASVPCPDPIIPEVDIYKFEPWDLPEKATFGEEEWYFFSPSFRKYPNGVRPNRAAGSGYWKAIGTDNRIHSASGEIIGVKKALVFYRQGAKTNWIMHEYRLIIGSSSKRRGRVERTFNDKVKRGFPEHSPHPRHRHLMMKDWVLCRICYQTKNKLPPSALKDDKGHTRPRRRPRRTMNP